MAGKYIESQIPIMQNGDFYYPLTTAKQTILPDGRRLGGEDGLNITADDVNALSVDLTDVEQGTATGINADTLGGKAASDYVLLDDGAQIDLEGAEYAGGTVLSNADLLAGMTYRQIMDSVYPVGRVIMTFESEDPNVLYSWQTWERTANGRFLLGAGDSYAAGGTGGAATHTLTVDEMPSHRHTPTDTRFYFTTNQPTGSDAVARVQVTTSSSSKVYVMGGNANASDVIGNTGGITESQYTAYAGSGQPHNNMPPYLAVNMWKRTA